MSVCERVRNDLDLYLSNELLDAARRAVTAHLEECPGCAADLEARTRVRTQLKAAVHATPLPTGLEVRIRGAIRGQRPRPRTGLWAVAAAAVVILCAALVGLWRARTNPEDAILRKTSGRLAAVLNVGLRDHLHCAVFRKYSKQPAAASQMAAELGPAFAELPPLVQAKLPAGFHIVEAHHCGVGGRQYTHFIMAGGGKLISLILTRPRPGESLSGGIYQAGVDRFQVVGFESHDYMAYLISDLEAQQNLQWAASLAPALRDYLSTHAG